MLLNSNILSFPKLPHTQADQLTQLRRTYGEHVQVTHDAEGWIIVDLSNLMSDEDVKDEPYLQDNTDITHRRRTQTFLRTVNGHSNRQSHGGNCQPDTHYASGYNLQMPRLS